VLNLLGEENTQLIQGADRLARFALELLTDYSEYEDPHKKAIMLIYITGQLLQATYAGPETIESILLETAQIVAAFAQPGGNA